MKLDVARGVLLDRLTKLDELIEQYRASLAMFERERLILQTKLRTYGWTLPKYHRSRG